MFQKIAVDKVDTHILCSLFSKIVKIMWIKLVQCGRAQVAIWRIRVACWIPKATNTHTQVV